MVGRDAGTRTGMTESVRMYPAHVKPSLALTASALALFLACPAAAATSGDAIVVTASRQPQRMSELLSDDSVIDREEIIVEEGLFQAWIDQIKSFSIEALSNK